MEQVLNLQHDILESCHASSPSLHSLLDVSVRSHYRHSKAVGACSPDYSRANHSVNGFSVFFYIRASLAIEFFIVFLPGWSDFESPWQILQMAFQKSAYTSFLQREKMLQSFILIFNRTIWYIFIFRLERLRLDQRQIYRKMLLSCVNALTNAARRAGDSSLMTWCTNVLYLNDGRMISKNDDSQNVRNLESWIWLRIWEIGNDFWYTFSWRMVWYRKTGVVDFDDILRKPLKNTKITIYTRFLRTQNQIRSYHVYLRMKKNTFMVGICIY